MFLLQDSNAAGAQLYFDTSVRGSWGLDETVHFSTELINLVHIPQELHATERIKQNGLKALTILLAHSHITLFSMSLWKLNLIKTILFLPRTPLRLTI